MIKLDEFWLKAKCPVFDAETKEYIDSKIIQERGNANVIEISVSDGYVNDGRIYVIYEKEPKDEA